MRWGREMGEGEPRFADKRTTIVGHVRKAWCWQVQRRTTAKDREMGAELTAEGKARVNGFEDDEETEAGPFVPDEEG